MENRRHIGWWASFLDSLDTGGGYVLGFFMIMMIGLYIIHIGYDMVGFGLITGATGAFYGRSKDGPSNRDNQADELKHTTVEVKTETPAPVVPNTDEGVHTDETHR